MKILQLIDRFDTGGAQSVASCLALSLRERGHEVAIACLRDFGRMSVARETFSKAGIDLIEFRKPEGFSQPTLKRLTSYIRGRGFDVIHTHNPLVNHYGVAAALSADVRVTVQTVHGIHTLEMSRLGWLIYQTTCFFTDGIVSVCGPAQESFLRSTYFTKQKATVIENGIDLTELLRVRPRAADGEFVFGVAGRLAPVKNHRLLIEAFAIVHAKDARCRLEILGSGELEAALRAQVLTLGLEHRILLRGWSSDVAGFLAQIDTFVLSSVSEGLPMAVLEAMAAARPIISTAVGGVPQLIEGAKCGWLCEPNSPEALADAMQEAMTSELQEKGERARNYVLRRFSAERMAEEYEALFRTLLHRERLATRNGQKVAGTR